MQGRNVLSKTFFKDESLKANVSSLVSGVYVLQLRVDGSNEIIGTAKFIKE
jgi:hypothetical protein